MLWLLNRAVKTIGVLIETIAFYRASVIVCKVLLVAVVGSLKRDKADEIFVVAKDILRKEFGISEHEVRGLLHDFQETVTKHTDGGA